MRMRRQNNRPFRRGPRKPNRMEGLPADEPDYPAPGTETPNGAAKAAPDRFAPRDQYPEAEPREGAVSAEPPPSPLPPGPHLEIEELQAKSRHQLKAVAKEYGIDAEQMTDCWICHR